MSLDPELIIYVLIFVGVLVLIEGVYLTVFGKSISLNNRVNRRLEMLDKGKDREQVLEQLRKEMTQHLRSQQIPLYSLLASKAQKANIAFSPSQLILIMVVLGAGAFMALTIGTTASLPVRAVVAVGMGVGGERADGDITVGGTLDFTGTENAVAVMVFEALPALSVTVMVQSE